MSLRERLQERAAKLGRPVRVGLVGAGQMGTGLLSQMEKMAGMRVVACADVLPGRARAAYQEASVDPALVAPDTDDFEAAADAIERRDRGRPACGDDRCRLARVDPEPRRRARVHGRARGRRARRACARPRSRPVRTRST